MKFANKLEALKWMCENPSERVFFEDESGITRSAFITPDGECDGYNYGSSFFISDSSRNFRTTKRPEPEAKEIDWDVIYRNAKYSERHLGLGDYGVVTIECLRLYHAGLMKLLGRK